MNKMRTTEGRVGYSPKTIVAYPLTASRSDLVSHADKA